MTSDLSIQAKKIELIQWLSTTEDSNMLDKILDLMIAERKKDWWKEISSSEKESIDQGIKDADQGNLNSHSKAKEIYGKWL